MKLLLPALCAFLFSPALALMPTPTLPIALSFTLRHCMVGELHVLKDAGGQVRFLEYGHFYNDNTLWVSQSYNRHGGLSGVRIYRVGFVGVLLDVRGTFDSRGRLIRETGYRRRGLYGSLRNYLQPVPKGTRCRRPTP